MTRYDQCDSTCTADCGHCKGKGRPMRPGEFTAHCQRGHDRVDFTDRAVFEAHMTGEHGANRRPTGGAGAWDDTHSRLMPAAPGWKNGRFEPYPWTAPRPSKGGLEKVTERIAAGEYDVQLLPSWLSTTKTRMGEVA